MNGLVVALTLCLARPAPGPVDGVEPRACYELLVFNSREECRITAQRVKVHVSGARLACQARERSYDERLAAMTRGPSR